MLVSRSFWNFRLKGEFQVDFILPIPFTSFPMGTSKRMVVTVGEGALLRRFVLCCAFQLQSTLGYRLVDSEEGSLLFAPVSGSLGGSLVCIIINWGFLLPVVRDLFPVFTFACVSDRHGGYVTV
jgi:hypothetical protein